jgi:phosphate transport system protein
VAGKAAGMPRESFHHELDALQGDVLMLGSMVEKAIDRAMTALKRADIQLARLVVHEDLAINEKRFAIDEHCLHLISTQQPMAFDLRTIMAIVNIIVDLERMGDHAEGIAKIVLLLDTEQRIPLPPALSDMADVARRMVRRSLAAFVNRDPVEAEAICREDDTIDARYDEVYHDLVQRMIADPETVEPCTHLMWVAHNLERIGDRVTNICERVVFMVTGRLQEVNVSKY